MIRVRAQTNAAGMLKSQAVHLGRIGDDQYYVLDGKVWKISANNVVFRSDDNAESQALIRRLAKQRGRDASPQNEADPDEELNLDGMDADALRDFWTRTQLDRRRSARRLFPDRPRGYVRATTDLGNYAANKATAMRLRAAGQIAKAQQYEAICQRIYERLPEFARW